MMEEAHLKILLGIGLVFGGFLTVATAPVNVKGDVTATTMVRKIFMMSLETFQIVTFAHLSLEEMCFQDSSKLHDLLEKQDLNLNILISILFSFLVLQAY